ncbi:1,2-phenylacetyl-CoA epoxidase, subunit C [Nymphon striatum]|nr:1,2-phenylacetyl-CoA epoxidase, subunit C [Nymphon striatum]
MMGQQHTEWIGVAPFLEEDLAFASIGQDELGHAALLLEILVGSADTDIDALAFFRDAPDWRSCALVECTLGDWGDTLVRHWFYDAAEELRWQRFASSSITALAELAVRAESEERFHRRHADALLDALLTQSDAADRIQQSVTRLLPLSLSMFDGVELEAAAVAEGVVDMAFAEQLDTWKQRVDDRFGAQDWDAAVAPTPTMRTSRHDDFAATLSRIREVLDLDRTAHDLHVAAVLGNEQVARAVLDRDVVDAGQLIPGRIAGIASPDAGELAGAQMQIPDTIVTLRREVHAVVVVRIVVGGEAVEQAVAAVLGQVELLTHRVDGDRFVVERAERGKGSALGLEAGVALIDKAVADFLAGQPGAPRRGAAGAVAIRAGENRIGVDDGCRAVEMQHGYAAAVAGPGLMVDRVKPSAKAVAKGRRTVGGAPPDIPAARNNLARDRNDLGTEPGREQDADAVAIGEFTRRVGPSCRQFLVGSLVEFGSQRIEAFIEIGAPKQPATTRGNAERERAVVAQPQPIVSQPFLMIDDPGHAVLGHEVVRPGQLCGAGRLDGGEIEHVAVHGLGIGGIDEHPDDVVAVTSRGVHQINVPPSRDPCASADDDAGGAAVDRAEAVGDVGRLLEFEHAGANLGQADGVENGRFESGCRPGPFAPHADLADLHGSVIEVLVALHPPEAADGGANELHRFFGALSVIDLGLDRNERAAGAYHCAFDHEGPLGQPRTHPDRQVQGAGPTIAGSSDRCACGSQVSHGKQRPGRGADADQADIPLREARSDPSISESQLRRFGHLRATASIRRDLSESGPADARPATADRHHASARHEGALPQTSSGEDRRRHARTQ